MPIIMFSKKAENKNSHGDKNKELTTQWFKCKLVIIILLQVRSCLEEGPRSLLRVFLMHLSVVEIVMLGGHFVLINTGTC